jgi:N-acetylgalactosamine-6-sulfatase
VRLREQNALGLPVEEQTIVRLLKEAGYATALTGKWHLGYEPKFAPHLHGFDYAFYCIGGGMDYFHYLDNVAGYNLYLNGNPIRREGYFTDLMTDEAISYLERSAEKPFFLYIPYTAPHSPFQGPDDRQPDPLPLNSPLWNQSKAPPDVYVSMIEQMDKGIGRILSKLDSLGMTENTIIFFAGDNGGTRSARNEPFSGIKGSTFEGGIRVPAIVKWKGVVPAGIVSDHVSATFDFTASIARIAGVSASKSRPFEGIDIIRHIVEGEKDFERTLYWRKPRGERVWKGVRQGTLKYVGEQVGDEVREYLFDLSSDTAEKNDLRNAQPEVFARLKRLYDVWEEETRRNRRGRPE